MKKYSEEELKAMDEFIASAPEDAISTYKLAPLDENMGTRMFNADGFSSCSGNTFRDPKFAKLIETIRKSS